MTAMTGPRSLDLDDFENTNSRRDRLRAAIARLGGYCDWRVDSSGWVVTLHLPEERTFVGPTLEAALSACVVWLTPSLATTPSTRTAGATSR